MNRVSAWLTERWLWCVDPICGPDRKPSNPKLMGWGIYLAFVVGRPIPVTVCALLLAASFGIKTFQMWLSRATFATTATDSVALKLEHTIAETVAKRRDPATGIEASE